jgi:tRNA(Ile)-lysidine synthase
MNDPVADVLNRVERFCRSERLVEAGESVLLAVSGGSDSTALLAIFAALRERLELRLHVAHLNHGLRGAESDADAAFVATLAERHAIPVTVGAADVAAKRAAEGGSLEAVARKVRFAFLDATARNVGATKIALAHHREDVAETFLMRLLRGAGSGGLGSIRPIRDGRWIRPLLFLSKEELRRFLDASNQSYREDRSNADRRFLRNRIRHELAPTLETYNPRALDAIARAATTLADEDAYLDAMASDLRRSLESDGRLAVARLLDAPVALRRRVVRDWLNAHLPNERAATFEEVASVCEFVADATRSRLTLRRRFVLASDDGILRLLRYEPTTANEAVPLRVPGETVAEGVALGIRARLVPRSAWTNDRLNRNEAAFDWERVPKSFALRAWRHGDRFQPFGMTGSKRVSRMLSDAKLRADERRCVGVVLAGSDVLWVVGVRADGRYPVTRDTQTVLHLTAYARTETT